MDSMTLNPPALPKGGTVFIQKVCPFCGDVSQVEVDRESWGRWKDGALIQEAFPDLSFDWREVLQTGICAGCWEMYMGEGTDD